MADNAIAKDLFNKEVNPVLIVPQLSLVNCVIFPNGTGVLCTNDSFVVRTARLAFRNNSLVFLANLIAIADIPNLAKQSLTRDFAFGTKYDIDLFYKNSQFAIFKSGVLAKIISIHCDRDDEYKYVMFQGINRARREVLKNIDSVDLVKVNITEIDYSIPNGFLALSDTQSNYANGINDTKLLAKNFNIGKSADEVKFINEINLAFKKCLSKDKLAAILKKYAHKGIKINNHNKENIQFTIENFIETLHDIPKLRFSLIFLFARLLYLTENRNLEFILKRVTNFANFSDLIDAVAAELVLTYSERLFLLQNVNVYTRYFALLKILMREIGTLKFGAYINDKTKALLAKEQKEYLIKSAIKVLNKELDEAEGTLSKVDIFKARLDDLNIADDIKRVIEKEINHLERLSENSPETAIVYEYLDTVLGLPFGNYCEEYFDVVAATAELERHHYGLHKVKESILEHLAVQALKQQNSSALTSKTSDILCLIGPPGIGKTSIAKAIAKALHRPFERISVGGIVDESEIRGHRRTYIGAMPGRIIKAIRNCGYDNPVILLDEIDKITSNLQGDPAAALLEVLDAEQNHNFRDHYLDIPYDLSRVMFIATANSYDTIPEALYDRMHVINLSAYTENEKVHIAKQHLWPQITKECGLHTTSINITPSALRKIISDYTREAGVRQLQRCLMRICRKLALDNLRANPLKSAKQSLKKSKAKFRVKTGSNLLTAAANKTSLTTKTKITIKSKDLTNYLGTAPYAYDEIHQKDLIGVVTGLAWTAVGGVTLEVEAQVTPGSGKINLTGNLGEVMKESAEVGWTYLRSQAEKLQIPLSLFSESDVHIHFPEGATPKDGPSAGITMATALCSLALGKKVKHRVAMTGEITLTGRVFPIGGLKAKLMAAYRANMQQVIIPQANVKDLDEVDKEVKEKLEIIPVQTIEEVWKIALID